jgi:cytochrome b pre-mRNA-processing protein 3|tara:strand:+ start:6089 stop:6613 length:525 start_codon:yes stop_codon:yes gene_type:complete
MFSYYSQNFTLEKKLYNNIIYLSRNKLFYTKFNLSDTLQNRVNLIFFHISFLLNKINHKNKSKKHKDFEQKFFDLTFNTIELNMREMGYGDVKVNKNMKFLIKIFYNILLNCENYNKKKESVKLKFLLDYLSLKDETKAQNNTNLVNYFNKYQAFCFDLCLDSVLKGDLNFTYK